MSVRVKNTYEERQQLVEYVAAIAFLASELDEEEDEADPTDWALMQEIDEDNEMLEMLTALVAEYATILYSSMEDFTINFHAPPLLIRDFADQQVTCDTEFRFVHDDLQMVADALWPKLQPYLDGRKDAIRCDNRFVVPYETGFLVLLYRLSRPRVFSPDMERFFRMRKTKLCSVVKTFLDAFHSVAVRYLQDPSIFLDRFPLYAQLIFEKSREAVSVVWGFIDGTLRRTCRPTYLQRQAYSGHKRSHGIKFQSIVTPDGLVACLHGPYAGSRHDCYMLGMSDLLPTLEELMPENGPNPVWSLYGDPAYPSSVHLFQGFRNAAPGTPQAAWNTRLSSVRETVEWGFNGIITHWSYLDFKAHMKIFQGRCAKYYIVGAFLTNIKCCLDGNQISN